MSEKGSNQEKTGTSGKDWLSLASMLMTVLFGTLLTGWLRVVDEKVNEAKLSIDRYGATSNYIALIGDGDSPVYLKSMALASMFRFALMDADLLFSTGYMAEDHQGPGVLLQLMYDYAKSAELIESPIGYVDLPGKLVGGAYVISGWALDNGRVAKIEVSLDDVLMDEDPKYALDRPDIASLYTRYPSALKSGYEFEIPAAQVKGRKLRMAVRLIDDGYHFMQILSTDVCFSERGAMRAILDESCADE